MPPIITKAISFGLKLHPIVVHFAKTPADMIVLTNSQIHFTTVHSAANKVLKTDPWISSNIFNRYPNINIPETLNNFWSVNEAAEATAMGMPITKNGVVTGTKPEMLKKYPGEQYPSNQANPDVALRFANSNFIFQDNIGLDWKNAMAKTQPHGKNQVIIATYEQNASQIKKDNTQQTFIDKNADKYD